MSHRKPVHACSFVLSLIAAGFWAETARAGTPASGASAGVIPVPRGPLTWVVDPTPGVGDFTDVAAALASSLVRDGDSVAVEAATYVGPVLVDKRVWLHSVDGPGTTVLDGGGLGTVVTISVGAMIQGFTITGGGGPSVSYGGVRVTSLERALIFDNVIKENHATGDAGIPAGGVGVTGGGSAMLVRNDIHSNTALSVGGVYSGPFTTLDVIDCKIRGNGGPMTTTGGMLYGASGRIVNVQITGNFGTGIGGLYLPGGAGPGPMGAITDVVNCTIYGNHASSPVGSVGGVYLEDGGDVMIHNTIIYSNFGSPVPNITIAPDFSPPGVLDIAYSHLPAPLGGVIPGPGMYGYGVPPTFVAPAMASPLGPTIAGDFHLAPGSIDIDKGSTASFPAAASAGDLGGVLRKLGTSVDAGAFEYGTSCAAPKYFGLGSSSSMTDHPFIATVGEPSVSGAGFSIELRDAAPSSVAILLCGKSHDWTPFRGGTMLVSPALRHSTGLTDPSGYASRDIVLSPILEGTTRSYQFVFRDTGFPAGDAGVSNGVEVTYCP